MKSVLSKMLFAGILLLALACKKDEEQPALSNSVPSSYYSQLRTGNYWIYQRYRVDGITTTPLQVFDSVYVRKDTLINNQKYFILNRPAHPNLGRAEQWLRDSLHYVVNHRGKVEFSSEDFTTHFRTHYEIINGQDTLYKLVNRMADKDLMIMTPAGAFETRNYRTEYTFYPPFLTNTVKQAAEHRRYAKGIGIVAEKIHGYASELINDRWEERVLVRYRVQ